MLNCKSYLFILFYACMFVPDVCLSFTGIEPIEFGREHWRYWTGVIAGCRIPCGFWEINPGLSIDSNLS